MRGIGFLILAGFIAVCVLSVLLLLLKVALAVAALVVLCVLAVVLLGWLSSKRLRSTPATRDPPAP